MAAPKKTTTDNKGEGDAKVDPPKKDAAGAKADDVADDPPNDVVDDGGDDEGGDDEGGDDKTEDKKAVAGKATTTSTKARASVGDLGKDELLADPRVKAELRRHAKKAADDAVAAATAEAERKAEREKMEETDRLKAEKEDEKKRADKLEGELATERKTNAFNLALLSSGVALVDGDALDFLRAKAERLAEKEELEIGEAISQVLEKNKYLVKTADPPADAGEGGKAKKPATTTKAGGKRQTEAPAEDAPDEGVDVLKLSPQEYQKYKQDKHGISH